MIYPRLFLPALLSMLLFAAPALRAADSTNTVAVDTSAARLVTEHFATADSLAAALALQDSTRNVTPWGAIWRTLVLPGWGQYYVESYWKAPIALGAAGFFTYRLLHFNGLYLDRDDAIAAVDPANELAIARLKLEREFYRDKRDEAAFFLGVTYLISVLDAYVGAHLYDFDVSDDLSAGLIFVPGANVVSLSLRW